MKTEKGKFNGAETIALTNSTGMCLKLCALGAGIMSVKVKDRNGVLRELTRLSDGGYAAEYHGLTVGRTAGRIKNATFSIGGKTAKLQQNNFGVDNLHGGDEGLHRRLFGMKVCENKEYTDVVFTYSSPDGEGGYFGNVDITVTYRVYENMSGFDIIFGGKPDCETLLDLTNHVYWNMSGDLRESVTEQDIYINASRVGVLNERLIVERISEVTPQFDFRNAHKMGDYVRDKAVLQHTNGYDHPFFLDARGLDKTACSMYSETSGIKLEVKTTYPCVVMYCDNYGGYISTCFECQYHPDGIHVQPDDCGVCSPQKPYSETTAYRFVIK